MGDNCIADSRLAFTIIRDFQSFSTDTVVDATNTGIGPDEAVPSLLTPAAANSVPVEPIITPEPLTIPFPTEPGAVGAVYFDSPIEINSDLGEWIASLLFYHLIAYTRERWQRRIWGRFCYMAHWLE